MYLWIYYTLNVFTLMSSSPKYPVRNYLFYLQIKKLKLRENKRLSKDGNVVFDEVRFKLNLAEPQDHRTRKKIKFDKEDLRVEGV